MSFCKACNHASRAEIDQGIVHGVDYRTLAARFGLSIGGVSRHKQHVKELVQEAMRARAGERAEQGSELMRRLEEVITAARALAGHASREGNYATANSALNTIVRSLEIMMRASGELATPQLGGIHFHATKNIVNVNVRNDDLEIAVLISEATRGFDAGEIQRLKELAENASPCATPTQG